MRKSNPTFVTASARWRDSIQVEAEKLTEEQHDAFCEKCAAALEVLAQHHALPDLSTGLEKRVMHCFTAGSTTVQASALRVLAKFEPVIIANHAAVLAAQLGSEEWALPFKVADVLCELEPDQLAEHRLALIRSVEHAEWAVRAAALRVLGMIPPASLEEAAPQIIDAALKDADVTVRDEALGVLAKVPPRALNQHAPLLASSVNHDLPSVRKAAMQGLAKLEPSALKPYGMDMVAWLADDDAGVRSVAREAFARLPRESRIALASKVVAHLMHKDQGVRSAVLEACSLLDHTALNVDDAKHTLMVAASLEDAQVREAAMGALAKICRLKPRTLEPFLDLILKRLRDDEPTVRVAALNMLIFLPMPTLQGEEVVKAIIRRLEDSESVVRDSASGVFASFLPAALERLRDKLLTLLSHADQGTRSIAASVLVQLPAATLAPLYDTLVGMLKDDAGREVAQRLLSRLSASTLAPLCEKLVRMLEDERGQRVAIALLKKIDSSTKANHAVAIVKLATERNGKGKSIVDLLELLSTCGSSASKANAISLSTLKTLEGEERKFLNVFSGRDPITGATLPVCKDLAFVEAMVPQLIRCLQDKSWSTRYKAIEVLATLRGSAFRKQLPTLLGMMINDEDEVPRKYVVKSLVQLSQQELKEHMSILTRTLDDPDIRVQSETMTLLSKGLDPITLDRIVPKLLEKLKAASDYVSLFSNDVVLALSRLKPAALLKHAAAFVSVLQGLADSAKSQVLRELEKKPLRNGEITKLLLGWANTRGNDRLASSAIRAIGALGPEEAHRPLLLTTLQHSDAPQSTDAAVWALHRLPPAELRQYGAPFVALVSNKSVAIRLAGVKVLLKLGPMGIAEHAAALELLLAPNGEKGVQASALAVLLEMDSTALATMEQPIIALFEHGIDQGVQLAALSVLAKMPPSALVTLKQPIVAFLAPDSDKKVNALHALVKMDPTALASLEQPIVALVDERHPSYVRCAALDVIAAFAPTRLEVYRELLFEHIDVVQETNTAALRAIGALAPPLNRDFAWQLAALTEHLRGPRTSKPEVIDRASRLAAEQWKPVGDTGGFKALLSLSRAQLSFCSQLVMTTLSDQVETNSETTMSVVQVLGRLWLGKVLDIPKKPEREGS